MSLIYGQNLSRRLVGRLAVEYPGSQHVEAAGLLGADDLVVWQYAAAHGRIVVSKDADFRDLALLHGPPSKPSWAAITSSSSAPPVVASH